MTRIAMGMTWTDGRRGGNVSGKKSGHMARVPRSLFVVVTFVRGGLGTEFVFFLLLFFVGGKRPAVIVRARGNYCDRISRRDGAERLVHFAR